MIVEEAVRTSETSVDNHFTRRRENLKSHKKAISSVNISVSVYSY
jgi:hypothetical protein